MWYYVIDHVIPYDRTCDIMREMMWDTERDYVVIDNIDYVVIDNIVIDNVKKDLCKTRNR